MTETTRKRIEDFMTQKRLAVVGVSRDEKDFTHRLFCELLRQGYDAIPVNPNATELAGRSCFARVQDIPSPVDGALLMTPPAITDQVVRDCADAEITRVWMHRGEGIGAVSQDAIVFCEQNDISVVSGFCPYMFLPEAGFFHRLHGFFMKLTGSYPT